jgi:hypothetical protein
VNEPFLGNASAAWFARFADAYRRLCAADGTPNPDAPLTDELERCARALHQATLGLGVEGPPWIDELARETTSTFLAAVTGEPLALRAAMRAFVVAGDTSWRRFLLSDAGARGLGAMADAWIASLDPTAESR